MPTNPADAAGAANPAAVVDRQSFEIMTLPSLWSLKLFVRCGVSSVCLALCLALFPKVEQSQPRPSLTP